MLFFIIITFVAAGLLLAAFTLRMADHHRSGSILLILSVYLLLVLPLTVS